VGVSLHNAKPLNSLMELKAYIHRIERAGSDSDAPTLPLGLAAVDGVLPEGGLPLGALHDIRGDMGPLMGFMAFLLGRVAARGRPVLWMDPADDLYLPGLQPYGLHNGNLVIARAIAGDKALLWALNEAVATPALGAVAAPLSKPDFTSLRRLSLAAREQGVTLLLMRQAGAMGASPALTRWHVAAAPSRQGGLPGVGETAWRLTLEKCRNGPEGLAFTIVHGPHGWRAEAEPSAEAAPAALTG
jgi:protein ImuA